MLVKRRMLTTERLVKILANSTGADEAIVWQHWRNLHAAGFGPSTGVTPRDAAYLLVALMGSETVDDSVATAELFAQTTLQRARPKPWKDHIYGNLGIVELTELADTHSLIDAVEALLRFAARSFRTFGELFKSGQQVDYIRLFVYPKTREGHLTLSIGSGMPPDGNYCGALYTLVPERVRAPLLWRSQLNAVPFVALGQALGGHQTAYDIVSPWNAEIRDLD